MSSQGKEGGPWLVKKPGKMVFKGTGRERWHEGTTKKLERPKS